MGLSRLTTIIIGTNPDLEIVLLTNNEGKVGFMLALQHNNILESNFDWDSEESAKIYAESLIKSCVDFMEK